MTNGYSISPSTLSGIHYGYVPLKDLVNTLNPLLEKLVNYDRMRIVLEEHETDSHFWEEMTGALSEVIELRAGSRRYEVSMTDPEALKRAVRDIHYDLHLEIRQRKTLLPVYYLCRTRWDYWSEYGLIVEDFHASPGYPFQDERLVKLMHAGHEIYFLRLSRMRDSAKAMLNEIEFGSSSSERIDELLYEVGRYVFQAIWHEDQKPALAACSAFGLIRFRQAMEILYLSLSGDLCDLRGILRKEVFKFFKDVYPQPALVELFRMIQDADGAALAALPQKVRPLYFRLAGAFATFLNSEVPWKKRRKPIPVYKILFSNLSRLELVQETVKDNSPAKAVAEKLETASAAIIESILSRKG